MKYQHFSINERELIQYGLWVRKSIRSIAKSLNRSPSSVSREIQKNKPITQVNTYGPRQASERALQKRKSRGRHDRLKNEVIRTYVIAHLKEGGIAKGVS